MIHLKRQHEVRHRFSACGIRALCTSVQGEAESPLTYLFTLTILEDVSVGFSLTPCMLIYNGCIVCMESESEKYRNVKQIDQQLLRILHFNLA